MDRKTRIKDGLNSDIYNKVEKLDQIKDETQSSTAKLADILDGYETKHEDLNFTKPLEDLEILDSEDVEIEINDEEFLEEYNNQVHGMGLNTLDDLLSTPLPDYEEDISRADAMDTQEFNMNLAGGNAVKTGEDTFTQNIVSPDKIDDFEIDEGLVTARDITEERNVKSKSGESKKTQNKLKEAKEKTEEKIKKVKEQNKDKEKFAITNHLVDIVLVLILLALIIYLITSKLGA